MKIILYSQPTCPQCKMIHLFLDKNNIDYEECQDIEMMQKLGIQHTPALSVDGELFTGTAIKEKIKELGK